MAGPFERACSNSRFLEVSGTFFYCFYLFGKQRPISPVHFSRKRCHVDKLTHECTFVTTKNQSDFY